MWVKTRCRGLGGRSRSTPRARTRRSTLRRPRGARSEAGNPHHERLSKKCEREGSARRRCDKGHKRASTPNPAPPESARIMEACDAVKWFSATVTARARGSGPVIRRHSIRSGRRMLSAFTQEITGSNPAGGYLTNRPQIRASRLSTAAPVGAGSALMEALWKRLRTQHPDMWPHASAPFGG